MFYDPGAAPLWTFGLVTVKIHGLYASQYLHVHALRVSTLDVLGLIDGDNRMFIHCTKQNNSQDRTFQYIYGKQSLRYYLYFALKVTLSNIKYMFKFTPEPRK